MDYQWHYRPKRKGDDITDPISGEFFADGSLNNPATALVREALQNALDAGQGVERSKEPVRVRIGIYRGDHALPASVAAERFKSLQPHLAAKGNGLRDAPSQDEPCEYLVVEDFGTSGLTGDIASDDADGDRNNFVDFVRSDGRTRKQGGDRGSWGVGKNVFPRASRINGFIAYTVRSDDGRQLVIGKAILKIRRVGDQQFQPPCYLAASWNEDNVPRPYDDRGMIDRLRNDFRLSRDDESGLSLIIPWVDKDITYSDLLEAVVDQFYFAILAGSLIVTLGEDDKERTLASYNLASIVHKELSTHAPMIELATWAMQVDDDQRLTVDSPPVDQPQKWSPELVPPAVRQSITQKLTQRERIAIRIPLHVQRQQGADPQPTYFDVYLEHHDDNQTKRPSFFREQLAISRVKRAMGVPRIRSLVVIHDKPLANLLRDAEPPNHTDWDQKTANFKKAYRGGNHVITFVKEAVKKLMHAVRAGKEEPDPTIAIDFFALPEQDDQSAPSVKKRKRKSGNDSDESFDKPERKPRRYTVADVDGGFVIRPGEPGTTPPGRLSVAMAYDVLNGSAWKQYEQADFDLLRNDHSGIQIAASGDAKFEIVDANHIDLEITGPEFEVYVIGFDRNRDLIVRAHNPKESPDADPAAELHQTEKAHA